MSIILVGNPGAGWDAAALPESLPVDPTSWGSRKIAAIREHRIQTNCSYQEALAAVEAAQPEFRGRWIDRNPWFPHR